MHPALRLALSSACVLLSALALPSAAAGRAGIDCAKAASKNERAICADPVLVRRDAELAQVWPRALKASRYGGELKKDQQAWLKARDRCDGQVPCLRQAYVDRLTELGATATGGRFDWAGPWTRSDGDATLSLTPEGGDRYRLELALSAGATLDGIEGIARRVNDDELLFLGSENAASGVDPKCGLTLHRVHRQLQIEQRHSGSDCGAAGGVHYRGRYLPGEPAAVAPPQRNLLDLGVVATPAADEALRRLLGEDYAALQARLDVYETNPDRDGLGAQLIDGYVRGLAANMRAALMQAGDGRVWVALRDQDARGRPEIRYYSNAPEWRAKLPATLQAWLGEYEEQPPVRLMSAGGRLWQRP